ncbi:MAG: FMN-binding protein [Desulfobulbaceae bacterium]|nr:FMN-binding protein [Desulfobulbaceae bacterium]
MKSRFYSVLYMFLLTFIFTAVVTVAKIANQDRILNNQHAKLQRVIFKVLHVPLRADMQADELQELFKERIRVSEVEGRTVYTAFAPIGETVIGHATSLNGPGFWGPIYAMVGVDAGGTRITGIEFYKQQETPGLGARISEQWFTDQFVGLSLDRAQEDKAFFSFTYPGRGKVSGELDAVTGATFTSKAVEKFLNRELVFLRKLADNNDGTMKNAE